MRILHVTNDFEIGGVQVYLSHLLPELKARGHELALVVLTGRGPLLPKLDEAAIPWRYIPALGRWGALRWPRWSAVTELSRYIDHVFCADIVHTHLLIGNTVGRLAVLRSHAHPKIIATEHSTYYQKPGWAQWLDRRLAGSTDVIMAVSETVRNFTIRQESLPADKVVTVRLGLVPSRETGIEDDPLYSEMVRRPTVGIVGRLVEEKGHNLFLHTIYAVLKARPDVLALVIGDGPLLADVQALARRLGMGADQVRFLGIRHDIPSLAKRLQVFLLPSRREGFGMAPLEAMAGGAHVVLSKIPAFDELTRHGQYGTLVALPPEGRVSDWAEAVLTALSARLDRARLRHFVAQHYAFDDHVDRLAGLYEEILRREGADLA